MQTGYVRSALYSDMGTGYKFAPFVAVDILKFADQCDVAIGLANEDLRVSRACRQPIDGAVGE